MGVRWAAVHLTIERDWWWDSDYCLPRRTHGYVQRCYAPDEVASIIEDALKERRQLIRDVKSADRVRQDPGMQRILRAMRAAGAPRPPQT